jgi:hypothetical protein
MAKLNTTVHVNGVAYGPGKDIPSAVAAQISNPDVWEGGKAPSNAGSAVTPQPALQLSVTRAEAAAPPPAASAATSEVPRKGGAGSGKDAWAAYAAAKGVQVPDDATRDDIVTALDAAGVPTESE